ncbi:MAG TPA: hypothetical protein VFY16_00275 [Gemmatimonadaceae bacterium]|jgi:predicted  nucleic acid-binding Zn-ribbon protein|nr:hypothetical protein [Gemmatimonadaceae bacterium]
MSASVPELSRQEHAIHELRQLVANLGDELSGFRRRAQQAEARVRDLESTLSTGAGADAARVAELERENAELRARLEEATERTRQLLDRMRFLRQQREGEEDR